MISFFVTILNRLFKLVLFSLMVVLLIALAWTTLQLASIPRGGDQLLGTFGARRDSYKQTATALAEEDATSSLRSGPRFVLLQDTYNTELPAATAQAQADERPAATAVPDDFNLPKLLVPLDPDEGKWLAGTRVPTRVPPVIREHRLINVIMLGSDEELSEDGFIRTDTMIIVSLNVETGTVAMLSLPRDLLVYIPSGRMGRLNTAYGLGENLSWNPAGGFGLLRQTLFYNFGINVHYHARVNFSGFETVIDRLGGINIAVDCAYRDLYPAPGGGYRWRTLPAGYYSFDGFDALWYARTRKYTDDFDRGRRHQQILRAIWRKARQQGLLATLPGLWAELTQVVHTDMPFDVMLRLLPFVIDLDLAKVENMTLKKNFHTTEWVMPSGAEVQLPNAKAVAALMQDFYLPPPANQLALTGPAIAVYNASGQDDRDIVASQRLRWDGFNAIALGDLGESARYPSSQLTDYIVTEKGSLTGRILRALNMTDEQVIREARADREYDYEVIIGSDYESCTYGVLPLDD
ncbi:MAG: LCP family protein [Chloroflexi bacterium]|nr:LCP family protein [Chloroflexota bacterium]